MACRRQSRYEPVRAISPPERSGRIVSAGGVPGGLQNPCSCPGVSTVQATTVLAHAARPGWPRVLRYSCQRSGGVVKDSVPHSLFVTIVREIAHINILRIKRRERERERERELIFALRLARCSLAAVPSGGATTRARDAGRQAKHGGASCREPCSLRCPSWLSRHALIS
eukprot:235861-Heterocapsa_arctica.AAC.1